MSEVDAISSNDRKSSAHHGAHVAGSNGVGLHLAGASDAPSGWYPDPDDTAGLRFWDGQIWSEHRARLSIPAAPTAAAVCSCGVVAIGRCRVCSGAYCRAHIASTPIDDRPFRKRWEAWTCGNCIEDSQREIRAQQLARCQNVAMQIQRLPKLRNVRTPNGRRPPLVSLFQHPRKPTERPPRYAEAYLIEYDGGPPDPRFEGLALSKDGSTVYNVGLPVTGVAKDRLGPKRNVTGYIVKNVIDLELLEEAADRSTQDPWFEYAARSFLRVAHHIGIKPDFTIVFDPPALEAPAAIESAAPAAEPVDQPAPETLHTGVVADEVQSIEVEHDPAATVQLQPPLPTRQPDPPLSPPLPLPHP